MNQNQIVLAVVFGLFFLVMAGGFVPGSFTAGDLVFRATSATEDELVLSVDYSEFFRTRSATEAYNSRITVPSSIQGDSDLPVSQSVCDAWGGSYSTQQGVCDIGSIPSDVEFTSDTLTMNGADVIVSSVIGSPAVSLPSGSEQPGCTESAWFNYDCGGEVSGTVTIALDTTIGGPACGDGFCSALESFESCPADCSQNQGFCGDGVCSDSEDSVSCPADCNVGPICGNGVVESGETCSTCPDDAGQCQAPNILEQIIQSFAGIFQSIINFIGGLFQ